jgi:hypothetical protein
LRRIVNNESHHFQSDYYGETTVHPLALAALLVAALATLVLPRRWALLPLIVLCCFVPAAQRIVLVSLDFTFIRLMVVVGFFRVVLWQEFRGFQLKTLDKLVLAWTALELALALVNKPAQAVFFAGEMFTRLGLYFMFRMLVRSYADIHRLVVGLIAISVPLAIAFTWEHMTARNVFSVFGGVPAITDLRQGRLRCQGAFAHPILAGCFWASVMPLMAAQWFRRGIWRLVSVAGLIASGVIVVMCASSTPIFGVLVGMIGLAMLPLRRQMHWFRWGSIAMLCGLHLVMNAPVWHLLARVSVVGGSTGWHRYSLIDKFISHWREWLVHGSARGTAHWGQGLFDVTNYYIIQGLRGGLPLLIVFLVLLRLAFRNTGDTWRAAGTDRVKLWTAWALGVCLAVHCANLVAVTYFGQINVVWYAQLAMIGSLVPVAAKVTRRKAIQPAAIANPPAGAALAAG